VKYIEGDPTAYMDVDRIPTVELTRRNLEVLLLKLDDPLSAKTLVAPGDHIKVRAVENEEHYADRAPGPIFMPSSGEYL
jgi:hypothetical protein